MKPIPSAPGYFASPDGTIYRSGKLIKSRSNGKGYLRIRTSVNGVLHDRYVHRLVCEAYHGRCPQGHECRHLDGNRGNNIPSNLAWATKAENEADKRLHGTLVRGERANGAKLSEDAVRAIRQQVAAGSSLKDLAPLYAVREASLSDIVSGKRWKHVSGAVIAKHNTRRFTVEQVAEIRTSGATLTSLAKKFGVAINAVWQVRARHTYVDLR